MASNAHDSRSAAEIDQLHASIARRLGDSSLPTLPHVAVEVLNLVNDQDSGIRDFVDVIKTDQALTGRLLRLANSAAYAQAGGVTELSRAIVVLGLERTKAMALGFHLSEAMQNDEDAGILWAHALMRAWIAFHIAERFNKSITGQAFVVGLMLDAGVSVMPSLVGDAYHRMMQYIGDPRQMHAVEKSQFEFTHADLVTVMTERMWKFPKSLALPIALHHESVRVCQTNNTDSLLRAIGHFVGSLPLTPAKDPSVKNELPTLSRSLFNLDAEAMRDVFTKAGDDFDTTKEMFGAMIDQSVSARSIVEAANMQMQYDPDEVEPDLDGGSLKFECDGTTLELQGKPGNRVAAYLSDANGNRLLSITIDPATQTEAEIRDELMLDAHDPSQVEKIFQVIRRLAA